MSNNEKIVYGLQTMEESLAGLISLVKELGLNSTEERMISESLSIVKTKTVQLQGDYTN